MFDTLLRLDIKDDSDSGVIRGRSSWTHTCSDSHQNNEKRGTRWLQQRTPETIHGDRFITSTGLGTSSPTISMNTVSKNSVLVRACSMCLRCKDKVFCVLIGGGGLLFNSSVWSPCCVLQVSIGWTFLQDDVDEKNAHLRHRSCLQSLGMCCGSSRGRNCFVCFGIYAEVRLWARVSLVSEDISVGCTVRTRQSARIVASITLDEEDENEETTTKEEEGEKKKERDLVCSESSNALMYVRILYWKKYGKKFKVRKRKTRFDRTETYLFCESADKTRISMLLSKLQTLERVGNDTVVIPEKSWLNGVGREMLVLLLSMSPKCSFVVLRLTGIWRQSCRGTSQRHKLDVGWSQAALDSIPLIAESCSLRETRRKRMVWMYCVINNHTMTNQQHTNTGTLKSQAMSLSICTWEWDTLLFSPRTVIETCTCMWDQSGLDRGIEEKSRTQSCGSRSSQYITVIMLRQRRRGCRSRLFGISSLRKACVQVCSGMLRRDCGGWLHVHDVREDEHNEFAGPWRKHLGLTLVLGSKKLESSSDAHWTCQVYTTCRSLGSGCEMGCCEWKIIYFKVNHITRTPNHLTERIFNWIFGGMSVGNQ